MSAWVGDRIEQGRAEAGSLVAVLAGRFGRFGKRGEKGCGREELWRLDWERCMALWGGEDESGSGLRVILVRSFILLAAKT